MVLEGWGVSDERGTPALRARSWSRLSIDSVCFSVWVIALTKTKAIMFS